MTTWLRLSHQVSLRCDSYSETIISLKFLVKYLVKQAVASICCKSREGPPLSFMRVQYIVDPQNQILMRVWTPGPSQD
jgi:hypothetical protein